MSTDQPESAARKRQDLGPFPFGLAVRARAPERSGWVPNKGDGTFTFKYLPVGDEIKQAIGETVNAQYWVGRQTSGLPYVSFEFHPNSVGFPELATHLATDFRAHLLLHGQLRQTAFLESKGKTVLRTPVNIDPNATVFTDFEIETALGLFRFIDSHIGNWRQLRLSALLRQAQGTSDALDDIETQQASLAGLSPTEREQICKSRIGQGKFRADLLDYWSSCAVTGVSERAVLKASHIKRWCDSTNAQRLDKFNGLLLTANLDALFDSGRISFADDGQMLIASSLSQETRDELGIHEQLRLRLVEENHRNYLAEHRRLAGLDRGMS